jgi:uncharacterized membrane protein
MPSRKAVLSLAVLLLAMAPLALGQGTYTQIDYPGATLTLVSGVNSAGDVVGGYVDASNNYHGFLLSDGVYTTIDDPDLPNAFAYGINDVGQIVGNDSSNSSYLYQIATQTFIPISFPGYGTFATGINNGGTIVGSLSGNLGFEYSNGDYQKILPHGSTHADLGGINNLGVAVGSCGTMKLGNNFLYSQEKYQPLHIAARDPSTAGINDSGTIVGVYYPSNKYGYLEGFVYEEGVLHPIVFPGAQQTYAYSVNDSGEAAGAFIDARGNGHGFTWTPPADAAKK